MLTGENSILSQAGRVRDMTGEKSIEERIQLAYLSAILSGQGNLTEEIFKNELIKEFGASNIKDETISTSEDGKTWTVTIDGASAEVAAVATTPTEPQSGTVENIYEQEEWIAAWTYNNNSWGNAIYTYTENLIGNITVKIYKHNDKYSLVVQGSGEMQAPLDENRSFIAWLNEPIKEDIWAGAVVTEIIICDGIQNVPENCFSWFSNLIDLTMTSDVTDIGDWAFQDCSSLESINLSKVTNIGSSAFEGCSSLQSIDLPNTISIGSRAFLGCQSLTTVNLSDKITSISEEKPIDNSGRNALTINIDKDYNADLEYAIANGNGSKPSADGSNLIINWRNHITHYYLVR